MASAHIEINGTATRHNAQLRGFVDRLQQLVEDAARLKAVFDQAALGNDWDALGDLLGVSASDAETIYALFGYERSAFASAKTDLDGDTFVAQLLSRMG